MRAMRCLLVAVVCLAAFAVPTAATAAPSFEQQVPVVGGTGSGQGISCGGFAPREPGCVKEMTITGGFTIRFSLSIVPLYRGYFIIRGSTETGSTTITCDWINSPGQQCPYEIEGYYEVGQTWTMTVLAAGIGYWSVSVS